MMDLLRRYFSNPRLKPWDCSNVNMVKIPLEDAINFEIKLTGTEEQNHLAEDDDLITYFEDIIAESLLDY